MRNGKGSLRRPMVVEPEVFAANFARTFGTTVGALKARREGAPLTDASAQRSGGTQGAEESKKAPQHS